MEKLTHVDKLGSANMVDISKKENTTRIARAHAKVVMSKKAFALVLDDSISKKGNVLEVAKIAGIMAAKKTSSLIPLCHNINLDSVEIRYELKNCEIEIEAKASAFSNTGVEMEALVAASTCALTIYDMLKAVDKGIEICEIYLLEKEGGKSGHYVR